MTRKKRIYEFLIDNGPSTAKDIASILQLDRANVSSDLNKLVKEGTLEKTTTRPVIFSVRTDEQNKKEKALFFDLFAKENKSVAQQVESAKSAILYPPHGMHTLLLGETGVGKSMFASLMHQYALDAKGLPGTTPFVAFNCADYANNPQLLLGQLFGIKKGAYVGASEQKGLLEKANKGILFLDEVHRLPPEGQEMLFTFIDRGTYRRLGETEKEREAQVLIIAATTRHPDSALLQTFTRRIPMVISLPALHNRTLDERFHLIKTFFIEESIRLDKEIHVTANSIRSFSFYHCPNNIGQLKADIQIACAKAYADYVTKKKENIYVSSSDLSRYVKEGLFIEKKTKHHFYIPNQLFVFTPTEGLRTNEIENNQQSVYEHIDHKYEELKTRHIDQSEMDILIQNDIQSYFVHYLKEINKTIQKESTLKIIEPNIVDVTEKIVQLAEKELHKSFDENMMLGLGLHIQTTLQRLQSMKNIFHPDLNDIRSKYKKEFTVALSCLHILEDTFQVLFPIDEAAFLTMFFVLDKPLQEQQTIKTLVLAHGNGIASEMASVTNQLLGADEVTGIDMPLHETPKQFLGRIKEHVKKLGNIQGLLILVDMGSLAYVGEIIETEFNIPVRVLTMVSTPHVLEAARKARLGYELSALYEDVKHLSSYYQGKDTRKEKQLQTVIITVCLTGEGSAVAIKNMLESHFHYNTEMIEAIPISLGDKDSVQKKINILHQDRNILFVVSNLPISVPFPTFYIQDILSSEGTQKMQKLLSFEETYGKMSEALAPQMKPIDTKQLIFFVRHTLQKLQQQTKIFFDQETLMAIVLHICSVVDLLKKNQPLVSYKDKEKKKQSYPILFTQIKEAFHELESHFQINIHEDEVCYMIDFFLRAAKKDV